MPKPAAKLLAKFVEIEVEDSSEEENSDDEEEDKEGGMDPEVRKQHATSMGLPQSSQQMKMATLRVQNWAPTMYKEALIFCPGYNSSMENSLKNLGQFLAMTKLLRCVYPIIFAWPGSFNLGYPYASKISATAINHQNMLKLVRGLKEAGINRTTS